MHILILLQKFAAGPGSFNTQGKKIFFSALKTNQHTLILKVLTWYELFSDLGFWSFI